MCALYRQQVRRGRYKNQVDVAVKTMKEGSMQEADFIDEAKTMMYLSCILLFLKCSGILGDAAQTFTIDICDMYMMADWNSAWIPLNIS